jgi:hypothetical protein
MSVLSILANTLGGSRQLARIQVIDPSTGQPAVDNNDHPITAEWVQDPVAGTALGTPADAAWSGTGASSIVGVLKAVWGVLSGPTPAGTNEIGTVAPRSPQTVTMTVLTVPANTSILASAVNHNRKSLQILNIGLGQATAKTFATAGTGGTVPTAPGQTSATSNTVTPGSGYPLQAAAIAGQQGGSTPIYDGAATSTDEWDVVAGSTATTILVVEGN